MAKRKKVTRKVKKKVKKKVVKKKRKGPKKPFGGMTICPDKNLATVLGKACINTFSND